MGKRVFKTELDAVNNSLQSQVNNSISKTIVDAKGDIVTASAADTPIRLAVGTNEHRLVADSATTSGLKYVADTTNYAVGAKGDLLVGTAADTVTNLAVGTNGHVLTADSATTSGLKWAAAAAGGFVGCSAIRITSNQTISNATWTAVNWNSEDFDTDGFHDNSTNSSRITIPSGKAGKYLFRTSIGFVSGNSSGRRVMTFYKNGSSLAKSYSEVPAAEFTYFGTSMIIDLVATDYIEIFVFQSSGGDLAVDVTYSNFQCQYLGA